MAWAEQAEPSAAAAACDQGWLAEAASPDSAGEVAWHLQQGLRHVASGQDRALAPGPCQDEAASAYLDDQGRGPEQLGQALTVQRASGQSLAAAELARAF